MSCQKEKKQFVGYVFTHMDSDGTVVQTKIPTEDLTHVELAEEFTRFLRGCGFIFNQFSKLVLVEEESDEQG